jgi:hypothetical protein
MLHPLLSRRVEVLHCRGRKCAVAVSPHVGNIMMVSTQSLQALACSTTPSTVVWRCSTAGGSECAFRSNVKKQKATNTLWALQSLARTTAALVSSRQWALQSLARTTAALVSSRQTEKIDIFFTLFTFKGCRAFTSRYIQLILL